MTVAALNAAKDRLAAPRSDVAAQFESLPADAPEDVRRQLAQRLTPEVHQQQKDHPFLRDLAASSRRGRDMTQPVVVQALVEFYNEAQLDVLQRVNALLSEDDAAGT